MNYSIYYHFFDRELRKSVSAYIKDEELLSVCCLSVFMTDNMLYLPISNLYESEREFPKTAEFIKKMDQAGLVYPVSSHETREGFILSRREYYSHDQKRYPMYFKENRDIWSPNIIYLKDSTTELLEESLRNDSIEIKELNAKNRERIKKFIDKVFESRKHKAITATLFYNQANDINKLSDLEMRLALEYIKQKISFDYSRRYLNIQDGTIITGIPGIKKYDLLAKDMFDTNFPIYEAITRKCGVNIKSEEGRRLLFNIRMDYSKYKYIYTEMKEIINLLKKNIQPVHVYVNPRIESVLEVPNNYPQATSDLELFENLEKYIRDICICKKIVRENRRMESEKSIVLLAVTSKEMKVLIKKTKEYFPKNMIVERVGEKLICRELINERRKVYLVQSEMGNVGVGSIVNTVHLVCEELNPEYIIMGGIAFGCDSEKQQIGDVLVSKQVWYYERAKLNGDDIIDRGDKIPASAWLLRLFRSSELEYKRTQIHFGLIASGEKLINSVEMMSSLKDREPELIGGDMEAAGLVSVCEEKKIEWIFAKAVCDWGMDKENSKQIMAAENAFDFIMYNLQKII